ncbi:MAG: hypothetical protein PHT54_03790 [Candidatus Nanoarchaeia archaeon]|nr:hypothetical protein [Candidatus Nanoarchaeia archaeon]
MIFNCCKCGTKLSGLIHPSVCPHCRRNQRDRCYLQVADVHIIISKNDKEDKINGIVVPYPTEDKFLIIATETMRYKSLEVSFSNDQDTWETVSKKIEKVATEGDQKWGEIATVTIVPLPPYNN